jgi:hypothetical protein
MLPTLFEYGAGCDEARELNLLYYFVAKCFGTEIALRFLFTLGLTYRQIKCVKINNYRNNNSQFMCCLLSYTI